MVVDTYPYFRFKLKLGWGHTVISSRALRLPAPGSNRNWGTP
jgi:hypothetical protein